MASMDTRRVGGRVSGGWVIFGLLQASVRGVQGRHLLEMLGLVVVYLVAGALGQQVAIVGNISPAWPPAGVSLAALVVLGVSRWPGVFVGASLMSLLGDVPVMASLGVGVGNTLAAVLGAGLLRWVGFDKGLERIRDVVALCAGAGALCLGVSASVGVASLVLAGRLPSAFLAAGLRVWWVGDLMGVLVVAPPLMLFKRWSWPRRGGEAVVLAGLTTVLGGAIFFVPELPHSAAHAAAFLLFPMSAWAALRFGPRGAAAATLCIAAASIAGTARGQGPFATDDLPQDLLVLQLFIAANAVTGLLLAAASTERQRAIGQLQLLGTSVRSVHEGVLIAEVRAGGALRTVFANQALCSLLGYRLEELVGQDPCSLYGAEEPEFRQRTRQSLLAGEPVFAEVKLAHKQGGLVWSEVLLSPVRATGEDITHFVATHRDISATKELQARLVAAERVAAVGTLAAGVGHEINNPLAYLVLNLEAAERGLSQGGMSGMRDAMASVRGALEGAERIRLIVRDLQVFSRQGNQESGLVDLNALVPPAVRIISHALRHRARLVEEFGPVPRVSGSEARLGQVLLNLLVNAMQAIPEGNPSMNEVRVRTSTDASGRARVDVVDSGAGIPAHVLPRIFEAFYTTKSSGEGTGLGLAICQQIVRAHGGELEVRSEPGRGSVFSVLLPPARVQASTPPRPLPRVSPPPPSAARRGRVLVVDDEPRLAQSMRLLLEPFHDVVTTTRGSDALALVDAGHRFDIILCDLQMPETDGAAVYQHLCAHAPDQAARVVFISGGAYTPESRAFIDTVPVRVLEKPVRPDLLMATVATALTAADAMGPEPRVDEASPVAAVGGVRH
ncbi:MASE1 domain-containing protein [Myxococcus xanthus]|uniref:histidine kinase n=1 Tax=Myxococcus xanthus TaxID=34 RepID=A0A7Y4IF07_MYXXA|nr:MASE1 domain-containing protein [Myxococcus xanthus]NOJ77874.1 response regulator [Myxococcus xanthus]NOJ84127.1 response regulator [Myxococcus xanthus]